MANYTGPLLSLTSPLNYYVVQCGLTWNSGSGEQFKQSATFVNSWISGAAPTGKFSPLIQEPIWLSLEAFEKVISDLITPNSYTEATLATDLEHRVVNLETVAIAGAPEVTANRISATTLRSGKLLFKGSVPARTKPLNDYCIEGVMDCTDRAGKRIGVTLLNSGDNRKRVRGCYEQRLERVYIRLSNRVFGDLKRRLLEEGEPADITIIANRNGVVLDLSVGSSRSASKAA